MANNTPFHPGELEVQQVVGEQATAMSISKLICESIPPNALEFISQQSSIWISIEDDQNLLWAFPLLGPPGFINPNDGKVIEINLGKKLSIPIEWIGNLKKGKPVGCLLIALSNRRRIRVNGIIKEITENKLQIKVQQSYPNCPKYIRRRDIQGQPEPYKFNFKSSGVILNQQLENIIDQSDTAFVASIGPNGADVSHRGGAKGFIHYDSQNKVIVPDYKGNSMFSTLGNFKFRPFGGLAIIDFKKNYFLQLSGAINIFFDKEHPALRTGGTNRFWELHIHKWQLFQLEGNFKWESLDYSPYNP